MWTLPRDVPDLKDIDTIAIDTEIKDLGLAQGIGSGWFNANGEVLGISLAYTNANASVKYTRYYFPLAHAGENISRELYKQLQTTLQNYTGTIVFHNAVFDIGWLGTLGITFRKEARIVDTGYAAALLDENRFSYRLDDLAKEDLGIGKDYTILEQRMQEMRIRSMSVMMTRLKELPAADVGPYAEQDAECTLRLWELYSKQIEDNKLTKVFDLECRGIPLLIAMRKQGVPIDLAKVHQLIDNFKEREAKIQAELDAMAGEPFPNTRTAKQVEIIVRVVGKEHFAKSSAGNYLTGKKHVGKLKHPFLEKIKELNSVRKLRKDFLENFLKFEINGRIHAEFHPLKTNREGSSNIISTKTGRYSSTCPNLTNIPADGELGKLIRSCFIPDKGCDWFCADYSQQEYRWAAHLAIRAKVRGWETVKRMYEEDPNLDFHNMGSQLLFGNTDPHNRKKVKTLGFGILYGQGLDGFASALGCSREEAAALLEEYREKVPFVTSIMKQAKAHVDNKGCIRTYYGRIRHYDFFEVNDSDRKVAKELGIVKGQMAAITKTMTKGDPWYNRTLKRYKTYSAINSACQGSAADQTKAAAVYMFEKYGIVPYIIVHDEFNIPVPAGDQSVGQKVIDVMENIFKLAIPVKAEGGTGANWAEAKG